MSRRPRKAVTLTVRAEVTATVRVHVKSAKPPPLAVTLPDLPTVPGPWRGAKYVIRSLLSAGDDNPKLRKSNSAGTPYKTWGLALAPATESGHQLCASASPGCRAACLFHQGHARLDPAIAACRIAKTVALADHRDWFRERLVYEMAALTRRADQRGYKVAVRLNLTSDVMWEQLLPDVFERFPAFRLYDYTKHVHRMLRFTRGDLPPNYHLTFSRSEDNEARGRDVLAAGGSVAVVFRTRDFPALHLGHPVIDGDGHDLRFLDPPGVVIGLSAKGTAKADATGFVVDPDRVPLRVAHPSNQRGRSQ